MKTSNAYISHLLKSIAASISLSKGNFFEVRAYTSAADAIEHSTTEVKDLWQEGKLSEIPGVGKSIQKNLDEFFKTGESSHFNSILKKHPEVIYELIKIPGVGPATASDLAKKGVESLKDLEKKVESGQLLLDGISEKTVEKIKRGLTEILGREKRMLLPYAISHAEKILEYIKKDKNVVSADYLGSLRRKVVTIGDLDFAAASKNPAETIKHFVKMPGVTEIQGQGEDKASVVLHSGLRLDLLVGVPDSYGALLQHFTGSKHHNIRLRSLAQKKGFSLSEYGVKKVSKDGEISKVSKDKERVIPIKTENELYKLLGIQTPDPEIREDTGEIEAALKNELPKLVELKDIKGDFHLHSNFPIDSSHDYGSGSLEEIIKKGIELGYKYIGLSDHAPALGTHTTEQIVTLVEKRTKFIQQLQLKYKSIRVLNGLEVDIVSDGNLALPEEALKMLDYVVAGVHSSHRSKKELMTKRILKALESPYLTILAHPTGRLLNKRDSYEADWEEVFKLAAENKKIMEINAHPNRLDLRDDLIRLAKKYSIKFIIDTDSHAIDQMDNMKFGVFVARRGWATSGDIVNTWDFKKLMEWFKITR